ncbi:hypothetical protein GWD52_17620 [Enterobacteriaceae bacterium 4M9]|nr:hypothetical protein [Enterobacteriaceae bacterium 4M9]
MTILDSDEELVVSLAFSIVFSIAFIILDRRALAKAGFSAPHPLWCFFLPPVYFYKRASITGVRRKYMFWIITVVYVVVSLVIVAGTLSYAFIEIYVEQEICEFLNTRTEQKYGQAGLETHACESVVFNVMDYVDDESNGPLPTEVLLKNGETLQMDIQITEGGNVSVISPYPW